MARILYVDDEPAVQRAVRLWLTRRGHEVHTAGTLADARAVLEREPVDGVFVDIWLGTESGFELQGWIDDHHPELGAHLAFVTGDVAPDEPLATRLEHIGRRVLAKPFDFAELEGLVNDWGVGG